MQAAGLDAQLQALSAERAEVAAALERFQAQHEAAADAASQAAAAAAQALSQADAQRAGLEEQVASLSAAAEEHARYQQELEGAAPVHMMLTSCRHPPCGAAQAASKPCTLWVMQVCFPFRIAALSGEGLRRLTGAGPNFDL